jgi:hypothetical protein
MMLAMAAKLTAPARSSIAHESATNLDHRLGRVGMGVGFCDVFFSTRTTSASEGRDPFSVDAGLCLLVSSPCSDSGDTGLGGPDDVRVRPSIPRDSLKHVFGSVSAKLTPFPAMRRHVV